MKGVGLAAQNESTDPILRTNGRRRGIRAGNENNRGEHRHTFQEQESFHNFDARGWFICLAWLVAWPRPEPSP